MEAFVFQYNKMKFVSFFCNFEFTFPKIICEIICENKKIHVTNLVLQDGT